MFEQLEAKLVSYLVTTNFRAFKSAWKQSLGLISTTEKLE